MFRVNSMLQYVTISYDWKCLQPFYIWWQPNLRQWSSLAVHLCLPSFWNLSNLESLSILWDDQNVLEWNNWLSVPRFQVGLARGPQYSGNIQHYGIPRIWSIFLLQRICEISIQCSCFFGNFIISHLSKYILMTGILNLFFLNYKI